MSPRARIRPAALLVVTMIATPVSADGSLEEANRTLLHQVQEEHQLSDEAVARLREIFAASGFIGQGNPAISRHPITPAECRERRAATANAPGDARFLEICGGPYMAPLYDPDRGGPETATVCIDQYEFPNIPCTLPVVWVRAQEAARICEAMGKRLCDAHEWEGACAGQLREPDYRFDLAAGVDPATAVARMRAAHNAAEDQHKVWSYGPAYRTGVCAAASSKSPGCDGGGWRTCGSNTYPTGSFPECRSSLGVYDLHGNAAEHMNLPLAPEQMASRSSRELGVTEMKGSWFIFDSYRAHEDACRWRAPFWHGSRVMDPASHHNYHLGFRCCKSLSPAPAATAQESQPGAVDRSGSGSNGRLMTRRAVGMAPS